MKKRNRNAKKSSTGLWIVLAVAAVVVFGSILGGVRHESNKPNEPDAPTVAQPPETDTSEPSDASALSENTPIEPSDDTPSHFEVHFLDVGQADAALVECDGKAMLIDGGNKADSDYLYTYLKNQAVTHLDYVIATHVHEDHIGGIPGALTYASADTVYCPTDTYDSEAFRDFSKAVSKAGASITVPAVNSRFALGSAAVEILACNTEGDINETSIVCKVTYGNTAFLFMADAGCDTENYLLESGADLKATVLKVGHHGSESATSSPFLLQVSPEIAVISAEKDNPYGCPTEGTLIRLKDSGAKVYRTDMQGAVFCTSDGDTVSVTTERNADADTLVPPVLPETEPNDAQTPAENDDTPQADVQAPSSDQPAVSQDTSTQETASYSYIGNKNSKKFHYDWCGSTKKMKEGNKYYATCSRDDMIAQGYTPCAKCNP